MNFSAVQELPNADKCFLRIRLTCLLVLTRYCYTEHDCTATNQQTTHVLLRPQINACLHAIRPEVQQGTQDSKMNDAHACRGAMVPWPAESAWLTDAPEQASRRAQIAKSACCYSTPCLMPRSLTPIVHCSCNHAAAADASDSHRCHRLFRPHGTLHSGPPHSAPAALLQAPRLRFRPLTAPPPAAAPAPASDPDPGPPGSSSRSAIEFKVEKVSIQTDDHNHTHNPEQRMKNRS